MYYSDAGRLASMNDSLKKQVFVASNWRGDDWWLTKYGCSGSCQGEPVQTISNLKVTSGGGPGPDPPTPGPYDPSDYDFGDACVNVTDCKGVTCSQGHCKFSWPKGSTW